MNEILTFRLTRTLYWPDIIEVIFKSMKTLKHFKFKNKLPLHLLTIYAVYSVHLAVILIWQFGDSGFDYQI